MIGLPALLAATIIAVPGSITERGERGRLLENGTVMFESGSSAVGTANALQLQVLVGVLGRLDAEQNVLLVGHTDDLGASGVNQKLSVARAEAIRKLLIQRGISGAKLAVAGVGAKEPTRAGQDEKARRRNRRVEAWLSSTAPVARVTWIRRDVQAHAPDQSSDWMKANVQMPLLRKSQVRTLDRSAGEVTFRASSKLHLGSNALVVVYDRRHQTPTAKKRIVDVHVEEGTLFASLARAEAKIRIATPTAEIALAGSRARVSYGSGEKASRFPVFDGDAKVTAAGKSVDVAPDHGTRVTDGQPPEPPARLPAAPTWKLSAPFVLGTSEGVQVGWTRPSGVVAVEIEVAGRADVDFVRPIRRSRTPDTSGQLEGLTAGAYWIRVASVDARGLVGRAGPVRPVLVLKPPRTRDGRKVAVAHGRLEMDGPGVLVLEPPPGVDITFGEGARKGGLRLIAPGDHKILLHTALADDPFFAGTTIAVNVHDVSIEISDVSTDISGYTRVVFRVLGQRDHPIPGLHFRAEQVRDTMPGAVALTPTPGARAPLVRCASCRPSAIAAVAVNHGRGEYSVALDPRGRGTQRIRIIEAEAGIAQELLLTP